MTRSLSHFEKPEPVFEKLFQSIRFKMVEPFIRKNSKMLDLGCGFNGELLKRNSGRFAEGRGYDVSVTKKRIAENIRLYKRRFDKNFELPVNYFNTITSLAVIEHLANPQSIINKAFKSLKRGGRLILTTPSPASKPLLEFLAYKIHIVSKEEIEDHKNYYDKVDLQKMLIKAGFRKKNIKIHSFELGFNNLAVAKK